MYRCAVGNSGVIYDKIIEATKTVTTKSILTNAIPTSFYKQR